MNNALYGGIEAGGTKFICVVGNNTGEVQEHVQIPTTTPEETMSQVVGFFQNYPNIQAIGIGSFGPVDLNQSSETYGSILNTPKQGWVNYNLLQPLRSITTHLMLDTDVGCAALGESWHGVGKDLENLIYLTVGTGIGGSCLVNRRILRGVTHSEIGHMYVPYVAGDEAFAGVCPYHGNCFEGLASGPAIQKRWNTEPQLLPNDHHAWELEARYLAYGLCNLSMITMPERIIIGGGVMQHEGLLERLQKQVVTLLANYVPIEGFTHHITETIVAPGLGELSAAIGALHIASQ